MKKALLTTLLLSFTFFLSATEPSHANNSLNLYQQLVKLNVQWLTVKNIEGLKKVHLKLNEKELIKTHLLLVRERLLNNENSLLSAKQKENRKQLLKELKFYAEKSVFPINTHHSERTPYFIDDVGTACAVGQLIIKSGNEEFANEISFNHNYSYIKDMPSENLILWAMEYGFTLDELKWIQPGYGPACNPSQVIHPICSDGYGCFNPDWRGDGMIAPVTMITEYKADSSSNWTVDSNNTWQFWGASPGDYRINITDSMNTTRVYNYTIINPPKIKLNQVVVSHNSDTNCNGKVTISPNMGTAPYNITMYSQALNYNKSNSTGIFDSLCDGAYVIVVNDSNYCQQSGGIRIDNTTGISEIYLNDAFTVQNPFSDILTFSSELKGKKVFTLITIEGKKVFEKEVINSENINTTDLKDGVYLLQLNINGNIYQKKIIKAN